MGGGTEILRNPDLPFFELKSGAEKIYSTKRHSHKELSIGFIDNGSNTVTCEDLEFSLNAGDVILIPPDCIHLCIPDTNELFMFKMLYINSEWFEKVFEIKTRNIKPASSTLTEADVKVLRDFISNFEEKDDLLKKETEFIYFLEYILFKVFQVETHDNKNHEENHIAIDVKDYLESNFREEIYLDQLSEISGVSKFSMLRKFKKKYSLTPHAYLVNLRINRARELLKQGKQVSEIAIECGFFDQSHFIKTFRQYFGMNPGEYRK